MKRKLFCQISPTTYRISVQKCRCIRHLRDWTSGKTFAAEKSDEPLPMLIYRHKSLIRRKLGNVHMDLQENKAVNLSLAAPKVTGILIRPGETFSFWHLVGSLSPKKGYLEGLAISNGEPKRGTGGGMCQFTNLIHWMILHTPLQIVEHHHHDGLDLFPDFNRQIPFGTGTSIVYNYLDYRFYNPTDATYQLIVYVTDKYLCGELRADKAQEYTYHILSEDEHFVEENGIVYRCGEVYRRIIDPKTGNCIEKQLIRSNHARVLYDTSHLTITSRS